MRLSPRACVLLATLGVTTVAGAVALSPSTVALAAPTFQAAPSVQIGHTDSADPAQAFDVTAGTNIPLGSTVDGQGRTHTSRVYATFDLDQYIGKHFIDAKLRVQEASAADCGKRAIEVWSTRPVTATPTWRTAPGERVKQDEIGTPEFCPTAQISFTVADAVGAALGRSQSRVTFELRVPEAHEVDPTYFRTLNGFQSVSLRLTYNSVPTIDNSTLTNAGFPCGSRNKPTRAGFFGSTLQAVASDVDDNDQVTMDFAVWPVNDESAVTHVSAPSFGDQSYATGQIPAAALTTGTTYAWNVRASDGLDQSPPSKTCYFAYDVVAPPAPVVTSTNYPPSGSDETAPIGVPGHFVFDGAGNPDVAGFEYTWGSVLSVPGCQSVEFGRLVCADPFSSPGTVKLKTPGASVTVKLSPPDGFFSVLRVRSVDLAGNRSAAVSYAVHAPFTAPTVTPVGGQPRWNQNVTLALSPFPGVTKVTSYEYTLSGSTQTQTVTAAADGTASITFLASDPSGFTVRVRSHSRNGFVSNEGGYSATFFPWPGVTSDIYTDEGDPHGGVGVPGTFTFTPPPGMLVVKEYRYLLPDGADFLTVPANADNTATITFAPAVSGFNTLEVLAVDPDDQPSPYSNLYSFNVA